MAARNRNCFALSLLGVATLLFSPGLVASRPRDAAKAGALKDAQPRLKDATFFSKSLQRDMHYRVLLPTNYETAQQRYPTLFLLHGLYGDFTNWTLLTQLSEWTKNLDLIIAMPDAGNSWY